MPTPFPSARLWERRKRASLGAVGPDAKRRAPSVEEDQGRTDIRNPADRVECRKSITADDNDAPQIAIHSRQSNVVTLRLYSPFRAQVAVLDLQTQAKAGHNQNAMFGNLLEDG